MAEVTEDRFCPICEQIVPREQDGIPVKISPSRKILLHEGCASAVVTGAILCKTSKIGLRIKVLLNSVESSE